MPPRHPGHAHQHLHPHPRGKGHHHPHIGGHAGRPSDYAHHHPIRPWRQPRVPFSTKAVKGLWRATYRWFPHAVNLGVFNCRKIAGSTSWSQHAWADAWDVASPNSAKTLKPDGYLDAIVAHLAVQQFRLGITRIIYKTASHFSHAHVDVNPEQRGAPPCAT